MDRVLLIHWHEAEAAELAQRLRKMGFESAILASSAGGPVILKRLLEDPVDAAVIDLSRLPSHGRDIAFFLRQRKATRHIPLVFVGGEIEKVSRVRAVLPDASFTEWSKIGPALKNAIKNRPSNPVVPNPMAGYSGTPLPKKLGIKSGTVVALIDAPDGFEHALEPLPENVVMKDDLRGRTDLAVLFVSRLVDMDAQFARAERSLNDGGRLWIAWPKQASGVKTDVTQPAVREFCLAAGWVDFKVCAIDQTWSGLAFVRRRVQVTRATK